jgi:hypothetical protein
VQLNRQLDIITLPVYSVPKIHDLIGFVTDSIGLTIKSSKSFWTGYVGLAFKSFPAMAIKNEKTKNFDFILCWIVLLNAFYLISSIRKSGVSFNNSILNKQRINSQRVWVFYKPKNILK